MLLFAAEANRDDSSGDNNRVIIVLATYALFIIAVITLVISAVIN